MESLSWALTSLAFFSLMFIPLERAFRARKQPLIRQGSFTDLLFFFGQYVVFSAAAIGAVAWLTSPVSHFELLAPLRAWFGSFPLWLQVVVILLLGDTFMYWGHRAQHRFEFLWRFHAVHHSNVELDWLGAHREHTARCCVHPNASQPSRADARL